MHVVSVRNVQRALPEGMYMLAHEGVARDSRNGTVVVMDGPVTTKYERPTERVMFWPERDANPYFHFMEGLWMLAGRNDVEWIGRYSGNIASYSDDGVTFHGAYGYRWFNHFVKNIGTADQPEYVPFNQLQTVVDMLKSNPNERRCVVNMWDPEIDLGRKGKDVPCNTQIMFSLSDDGKLDMTVVNRSNDIIWGAYGANAVHFSMMMEIMAAWIGVPVGTYWQISNNYHAYEEVYKKNTPLIGKAGLGAVEIDDPYEIGQVKPYQMMNTNIETWFQDLSIFMDEGPIIGFRDLFFRKVVTPIYMSHKAFKIKDDKHRFNKAFEIIENCAASDWRVAIQEWLERRMERKD